MITVKGISVVVPFLNEAEIIEKFCFALDEYQKTFSTPLELVFVDDGSIDNTIERIKQFNYIHKIRIIQLSKNYGSHAAIRAGLLHASYDVITWMGSDLQDPLELLDQGLEKIKLGYDAVYFEKKAVKVSLAEKMFSGIYSRMMRKYAVKEFESGGINSIMMNQKVLKTLNGNIEANSSVVLQILNSGFKHTTITLEYLARSGGKSKWTLSKKIKLFIDSFVAFSFMPIRMVSIVGILMFVAGCLSGIFTIVNKFVDPTVPIGYSTLASIMALGFGITNISLGIIAEYLWRTYDAARKRPTFIVSEVIDIENNSRKKE
jgi:dolichol-phosphate mannosyltransferase